MAPATDTAVSAEQATRWDWWPLARFLTVLAVAGAVAGHLGWSVDLVQLRGLPGRIFEVFTFVTLASSALAHAYLILLMLPLYATVTLNDTFYDLSVWIGREAFRIPPGRVLSLVGLGGELLLFAGSAALVWRVLH